MTQKLKDEIISWNSDGEGEWFKGGEKVVIAAADILLNRGLTEVEVMGILASVVFAVKHEYGE